MTTLLTERFRVLRGSAEVLDTVGPSVLALGCFDGVHTGHQVLLGRAAVYAAGLGLPVGAATFERPPKAGGALPALGSLSDELRLLRECGMEFVVLFPGATGALGYPDQLFPGGIPLEVIKSQLVVLGAAATSSGAGGAMVSEMNVEPIDSVRPVACSGVSATRIRDKLGTGDITAVNRLLGRPYELVATVRGRSAGRAWASVPSSRLLPRSGPYTAVVEYRSNAARSCITTTVTVPSRTSDRSRQLSVPINETVDHGKLRIRFIHREPHAASPTGSSA